MVALSRRVGAKNNAQAISVAGRILIEHTLCKPNHDMSRALQFTVPILTNEWGEFLPIEGVKIPDNEVDAGAASFQVKRVAVSIDRLWGEGRDDP